ncbi:DUF6985 domain-containing protein, partial [Polaribacter atrinae]
LCVIKLNHMGKHKYWGKVEEDWAGYSGEIKFKSENFDKKEITIFLGSEFDEDGEEIETIPTENELDDFENTYLEFLKKFDNILIDISEKTFERYLKLYAHYYENQEKSGEKPLNIDTKEKHFENIKEILYLRVLKNGNIQIPIRYKIDTEHGVEIRLEKNKVIGVGGIAET